MRINEENFLEQLNKENEKALDYVIKNYSGLVNGISISVLNNLGDKGLIEECNADVFLAVWNNISSFRGDSNNFKSWIAKITRFKAIDYYRKHSRQAMKEELDDNLVGDYDISLNEIEESEIVKEILSFEEPDKSIFIMRFILGLSAKEVGEKLSLSQGAIDSRVFRGKKKIRDKFLKKEVI
ncbi:RNA polymerase sigma-70 factor, ECF subfamily [Clostridium cavendishii DSM 21758]|uniref:RNA polymerase sigma-70 factor, ECF subfamily n=1 Tax=Clostridium cavendishii DSM 21758 TaxID=1121302 RepID=A0A1M6E9C3_9CLOT|nr:sigma-70 family RNA polymerase sigma factor [Clostridium cavendishii]SHI81969.1 RNA polymerase sigma-70 factor, ECF subfamily [Clostridium cavendishii DSM 21758]